ncbi:hypothetical protein Bca4012_018702 [Brassica carinata]|uniref:Uncharacterized protein n=1 Tax=Brassica carinata TaxID=52824 RepID=A0A8X7WN49_BRACI|nr:hypothetical protein Bca52824_003010 [Brassica carinata]
MQILNTEEEHLPFHLRIAEYDVVERGEPSTEPWRELSEEALRDPLRDPSKKSTVERRSLGRRSVERRSLGRRSVGGEERRCAVCTKSHSQSPQEREREEEDTRNEKLFPKSIFP